MSGSVKILSVTHGAAPRAVLTRGTDILVYELKFVGDTSQVSLTKNGASETVFSGSHHEGVAVFDAVLSAVGGDASSPESGVGQSSEPTQGAVGRGIGRTLALLVGGTVIGSLLVYAGIFGLSGRPIGWIANPGASQQVKAPDNVRGYAPDDEADPATLAGGNDMKAGRASANGATGEALAGKGGRRPSGSPSGTRPPDMSKLPPLPNPSMKPPAPPAGETSKAETTGHVGPVVGSASADTAATSDGQGADAVVNGLDQRAKEAAESSKAATRAATVTVAKIGADNGDDEVKRLKAALGQLSDGDRLSRDTLRTLPPDLAKVMVDSGMVETPEQEQVRLSGQDPKHIKLNIIRLPSDVLEKYKDADGISTIPESNSWATTGGNVIIPLPGGGEIRKPSDLRLFNLDG